MVLVRRGCQYYTTDPGLGLAGRAVNGMLGRDVTRNIEFITALL